MAAPEPAQCLVDPPSVAPFKLGLDAFDTFVIVVLIAIFIIGFALGHSCASSKCKRDGQCDSCHILQKKLDTLETTLSDCRTNATKIFDRVLTETNEHMTKCPYGKDVYVAGKNQTWHRSRDCQHIAKIPDGCLHSLKSCGTCATLKTNQTPLHMINKKTSKTLMDDINGFQ